MIIMADRSFSRRKRRGKCLAVLFRSFNDLHRIARTGVAFFQNDDKNPFARHDAVAGLAADRAVRVAFLADLRDLAQRGADA